MVLFNFVIYIYTYFNKVVTIKFIVSHDCDMENLPGPYLQENKRWSRKKKELYMEISLKKIRKNQGKIRVVVDTDNCDYQHTFYLWQSPRGNRVVTH